MTKYMTMLARILRRFSIQTWELRGYDTFAGEWYPIPGRFFSERAARRAAQHELKQLEQMQPTKYSGGQHGIQDQVYIVHPDGKMIRYPPGI